MNHTWQSTDNSNVGQSWDRGSTQVLDGLDRIKHHLIEQILVSLKVYKASIATPCYLLICNAYPQKSQHKEVDIS